jgi:hypothetical protein
VHVCQFLSTLSSCTKPKLCSHLVIVIEVPSLSQEFCPVNFELAYLRDAVVGGVSTSLVSTRHVVQHHERPC